MVADRVVAFEVLADDAGQRLDALVARELGLSHGRARALCEAGSVRLDGRRAKKGIRVHEGGEITVEIEAEPAVVPEPELPLDVRLERANLVVVCKPAGMPSVPLAPGERGTLAGALLARYPEMRDVGYRAREPGLLHRLDTATSGLLVAARNVASFERLLVALRSGELDKRYLAVVPERGLPAEGSIELPLVASPHGAGRVVAERGGRPSITRFRVLERGARFALLELRVGRAYRHQIRAHLAALGHPLVGDELYWGAPDARLPGRHALHASYVAWAGEATLSFAVADGAPQEFFDLVRDVSDDGSSSTS